jgi:preprotein translocase subunit SecG
MFGAVLGIHILVCAGLIVVVLLQSGKGGGLAGAFGGAGGVGAVFGGQAAATFLTKATRYLAIAFMLTSLSLALVLRATTGRGTVIEGLESRQPAAATSAGEAVVPQETPAALPAEEPSEGGLPGQTDEGAESGLPAPGGQTADDTGGEAGEAARDESGEEMPVVPEGE